MRETTVTRSTVNAIGREITPDGYATVKKVADEIESVKALADSIDANTDFNAMAEVINALGDSVSDLAALAQADLIAISADLNKGNYLGNRKIDIDLALNNTSDTVEVTYQGATITTNQGEIIQINFTSTNDDDEVIVEELASFTAIYNAITDGIDSYNTGQADPQKRVVNTEIDIINSTLPELPTMIRFRDTDGSASSIDRIQLQVYAGSAVDTAPTYFWAKTTSALQTLANRVGDVIALGNDIDSIIVLASQTDEIGYLYEDREKLTGATDSLYSELSKIQAIHADLAKMVIVADNIANVNTTATNIEDVNFVANNIVAIQNAQDNADTASAKADEATISAANAKASEDIATTQAGIAAEKAESITGATVGSTTTGIPGSEAVVTFNSADSTFNFSIPQGDKGSKGEAFQVNSVGLEAGRAIYDDRPQGFSFLATDTSVIYFKETSADADWSGGAPFGKGDKGDKGDTGTGIVSLSFTSTTDDSNTPSQPGATDTYTLTYTDGSNDTYDVYNGVDLAVDDTDTSTDKVWSSEKVNNELAGKADTDHSHSIEQLPEGVLTQEEASSIYATQQQLTAMALVLG